MADDDNMNNLFGSDDEEGGDAAQAREEENLEDDMEDGAEAIANAPRPQHRDDQGLEDDEDGGGEDPTQRQVSDLRLRTSAKLRPNSMRSQIKLRSDSLAMLPQTLTMRPFPRVGTASPPAPSAPLWKSRLPCFFSPLKTACTCTAPPTSLG